MKSNAHAGQIFGELVGTFQPIIRGDWQSVHRAENRDWPMLPAPRHALGPALQTSSVLCTLTIVWALLGMDTVNMRAKHARWRSMLALPRHTESCREGH